ncbi:hypothetical protein G8A07_25400 [Roseateles sp. DAIF2]|uniref:hypothetical protein n=1 Tax=Roseateles sp. DAIF2 TaxID=2714952 RepID=UPI0018A2A21B|nr:hypothetical protein [Roseateles sp. DAIF2]QPF75923.1 hypothetical protein G8A07_25400 [Roseateles sp. DAIF2]
MLRALVVMLLLANLLALGWSQGWLDRVLGLHAEREPERLKLENHPERMTVLSPQAVTALQTRSCQELGPLAGDEGLRAAQAALERLGLGSADWQVLVRGEQGGLWVVATIKLGSAEFRARKEETYKRMKLNFEPLQGLPDEQPSLVLSEHPSEQAAASALAGYEQRALKGLRVLQLRAAQTRHALSLPRADAALTAQLQNLLASGREPALAGATLAACPAAPEAAAAASAAASR